MMQWLNLSVNTMLFSITFQWLAACSTWGQYLKQKSFQIEMLWQISFYHSPVVLGFNHLQGFPSQIQIIIIDVMFVESYCTVFEETSGIKLIEIHFSVLVASVYCMHRVWQDSGVCWFWNGTTLTDNESCLHSRARFRIRLLDDDIFQNKNTESKLNLEWTFC